MQLSRFAQLILFLFCFTVCSAQPSYVPVKVPAKYEKELQEAVLMAKGGQVETAIGMIEEMIQKYPSWTTARKELSSVYYKTGQKQKALTQLEALLAVDTASQLQELYTLGRIYEEVSAPQRALDCYKGVISKGGFDQELVRKATESAARLEQKMELWESNDTITFHSFDDDINTPNHESLGRWTLDGQHMVFTRLVFEQEDIFMASLDTAAMIWKVEDFPHNTPQNEGAHAVSPDGNYLVFTACNRHDGMGSCDLYLSVREKGMWSVPVNMGPAFNSASWDGHPCFGLDGLSLFYSSSRPGGMGGRDIWYVYQVAAGKWSKPVNAGPVINTSNHEESPFVHFDGQTIYFMRDGKDGLGGYDLYISRKALDGTWQTVENLGAPINSGTDEGALTLHPDGRSAIITRMNEMNKNDLFAFTLPEKFRSEPINALKVTIKDAMTNKPVRARIELFEVSDQDTIRLSQWADNDGRISVATRKNMSYGVMASADGYIMYSANLDPDSSAVRYLDIGMIPLVSAADKVIVLENIFFQTGSSTLLPASEPELSKLLWTLRKNTDLKIEIRGHTDNVGEEQVNQVLSEARAKAVYQYLTDRGVEAARLTYVGFGESQPVSDNGTEEGRKQNRRTEFRIISTIQK